MNEQRIIKIRFDNVSIAEANQKAATLRQDLLDISPDVRINIQKDDPTNQDFGATLVLVLGTPAVILIARGIANYLSRDRGKITIEVDGKVVAEGISGDDAVKIAEAMSPHE